MLTRASSLILTAALGSGAGLFVQRGRPRVEQPGRDDVATGREC